MRQLKFRAWVNNEEMVYLPLAGLQYFDFEGSYVLSFAVDGYEGFWAHEQYDTMSEKASKFPVMQFTGLSDKNGKEIYEGDIVRAATEEIGDNFQKTGRFYDEDVQKVYWDDEAAGWFLSENRYGHVQPMAHRERFVIVGNIYQHPELLQEVEKGIKSNKSS